MPKKPEPMPTHEFPDMTPREYDTKPGYWIWTDNKGFVYERPITPDERQVMNDGDWHLLKGWRI